MGMGPFSSDTSKVDQTSTQQQQGVQGGTAFGAINDVSKAQGGVFGGGSSGNVSIKVDKGAFASASKSGNSGGGAGINVVTYDPAAAIAALQLNQATSTQAISYGSTVATNALETLRTLQAGRIVADSGGNQNVLDALENNPEHLVESTNNKQTKIAVAAAIALTVVAIAYYYSNIKP